MRRREAGVGADLDRSMAIAAVDPEIAGVVLVAERHRLRRCARDDIPILRPRERKRGEKEGQRQ